VVEEDKILEAEEEVDYYRLGKDKLDHLFNPRRDINPRWQFCACEAIQQKRHVWLARALTTLDRKKTYALYGKFRVQWWMPIGRGRASKKSLLDEAMDREFIARCIHTLWKCGLHGARQEARPKNSLHITKLNLQ
jgi:hypothetical protein